MPFTGQEIRRLRGASRAHLAHVRLLIGLPRLAGSPVAQSVRAHFFLGLAPRRRVFWTQMDSVLEVRRRVSAAGEKDE